MKISSTFTKLFVTGLFVLGLALPGMAAPVPQPFDNVDSQYADWGDEYGDADVIYNDVIPQGSQHKKDVEFFPNASQDQSSDLQYHNDLGMKDKAMSDQQSGSHWMIDEDW